MRSMLKSCGAKGRRRSITEPRRCTRGHILSADSPGANAGQFASCSGDDGILPVLGWSGRASAPTSDTPDSSKCDVLPHSQLTHVPERHRRVGRGGHDNSSGAIARFPPCDHAAHYGLTSLDVPPCPVRPLAEKGQGVSADMIFAEQFACCSGRRRAIAWIVVQALHPSRDSSADGLHIKARGSGEEGMTAKIFRAVPRSRSFTAGTSAVGRREGALPRPLVLYGDAVVGAPQRWANFADCCQDRCQIAVFRLVCLLLIWPISGVRSRRCVCGQRIPSCILAKVVQGVGIGMLMQSGVFYAFHSRFGCRHTLCCVRRSRSTARSYFAASRRNNGLCDDTSRDCCK